MSIADQVGRSRMSADDGGRDVRAGATTHAVRGYRSDIDGLRTLAVLPVILFHLDIGIFTGGYVGVDVFFVISGYLITSIIARELTAGNFSVLRFYERRFRRILPALCFVVLACLIAGLIVLSPHDLSEMGRSVAATALFSSNFLFWNQAGYFDAATELKPLIHTWSLAVEEQFYIVFPLLLGLLWKRASRHVVWILSAILVVSLALSVIGVAQAWSAAYFLLPFRAWELLVGSLLAVAALPQARSRWLQEALGTLGLLGIVLPAILLEAGSPFPGINAVPPVLGAALLIHVGAGGTRSVATRLLSLRPIVLIGLLSYSLYLWHWPLIVFARFLTLSDITPRMAVTLLALTFLMSWISWRFVERPFRTGLLTGQRALLTASVVAIGLTAAAGAALVVGKGVPSRFPELAGIERRVLVQRAEDRKASCVIGEAGNPWPGVDACTVARGPGTRILLWGDSHANHFVRALRQTDAQTQGNIIVYGMTACVPILGVPSPKRPNCVASKERIFDLIRENHIQRVLIAGLWQPRADRVTGTGQQTLANTVRRLRDADVEVVVIGDTPSLPIADPLLLYPRLLRNGTPQAPLYITVRNDPGFNRRMADAIRPTPVFDPMPLLCRNGECMVIDRGEPLFVDENHLSRLGARRVLAGMGRLLD